MTFNIEPFQKRVEKPWGAEIIYTPDSLDRTGKILMINAGRQWSFHFHDQKEETLCLLSGAATLWLEDAAGTIQKLPMQIQRGYTIAPGQKHRVMALEDCVVIEVSEPERGTTVRLEDDYKRSDETEAVRKQNNRGWHPAK